LATFGEEQTGRGSKLRFLKSLISFELYSIWFIQLDRLEVKISQGQNLLKKNIIKKKKKKQIYLRFSYMVNQKKVEEKLATKQGKDVQKIEKKTELKKKKI